MDEGIMGHWLSELGAVGVLGASFLLILKWLLTRFEGHMAASDATMRVNTAAILALQQQLLRVDLTVMALNPEVHDHIDEKTNRAYIKYVEIQKSLSELRHAILKLPIDGSSD